MQKLDITNKWIDKKEIENIQQAEASGMEQDKSEFREIRN